MMKLSFQADVGIDYKGEIIGPKWQLMLQLFETGVQSALQFGLLMCDEELLFLPRGFIVCAAEQIVMNRLEGQEIVKVNACAAWPSSLDQQDRFVSAGVLLHDGLIGNGNWVDPLPAPPVQGAIGMRAYNTSYYTENTHQIFFATGTVVLSIDK